MKFIKYQNLYSVFTSIRMRECVKYINLVNSCFPECIEFCFYLQNRIGYTLIKFSFLILVLIAFKFWVFTAFNQTIFATSRSTWVCKMIHCITDHSHLFFRSGNYIKFSFANSPKNTQLVEEVNFLYKSWFEISCVKLFSIKMGGFWDLRHYYGHD